MSGNGQRRVLIDEWFPINEASVESLRERSAFTALPALYFLHVWFARRPLVASRAAILTSLLPEEADKKFVLRLLGIPIDKDLLAAQSALLNAKSQGTKLTKDAFSWERAFKHVPRSDEMKWLKDQLNRNWGRIPMVLDPMAGGGSIPYEAIRLGLPTILGDLNPVAFVCLKGTVEYPAKFREELIPFVEDFCKSIHQAAKKELEEFFPKENNEKIYAHLWARTITCKHCGLIIPLSPNWWLFNKKGEKGAAVKIVIPEEGQDDVCSFEIVYNPTSPSIRPDDGTDVGKEAKCPRCKRTTDGETIKKKAQEGAMGHQLYALCTKRLGAGKRIVWHFRSPTREDLEAVRKAEETLQKKIKQWEIVGLVPNEDYPENANDNRPIHYGMKKWRQFFSPRQLLTHLTYLEKFIEFKKELFQGKQRGTKGWDLSEAVATYAAIAFDTCVDYNCLLSLWDSKQARIKHAMSIQGFPFKTSYAEWDQPSMLWPWALNKTIKAIKELVSLLPQESGATKVYCGDSAKLLLKDASVDAVIVDPPYHENVMYGEVSDFFYVWLKRLVSDLFPDAFRTELTDKEAEAIANSALFRDAGRGEARKLADQHYQSKMEACFKEMARVLRDDGVMTVMFTHRKAEAWAGLAKALINAGFTFRASWPVFTEPGKFGKRKKGVLKVTVLLACRERIVEKKGLWEEVKRELYAEAERKIREHSKAGITGPDLLVSAYGPVLGKFADYSLVKDATGKTRGPEDALELVAEVVNKFLTADIPGADLDTMAYLNLVRSFPQLLVDADLARIATVFGGNISLHTLDVKGGKGLVELKGGKVKVLVSKERLERGILNPAKPETLRSLIDIVHACLISYERLGIEPVKNLLKETGKDSSDSGFLAVLRAIAHLGMNGNGAKDLIDEARICNVLLEALGHEPESVLKKGERLTHYL